MALNIPTGQMTAEELEELEKQKKLQLTAAGVNKPGTETQGLSLNIDTVASKIGTPIEVTYNPATQPTINKYNDYFKQNAEFDDAFAQIDALNDLEYGKQPVDYNTYFAQKNEQNKEILKENLRLASMSDSERVSEIQRLSEESGLPPSLIEGNVEEVKRMITLLSLDAERLAIDSPVLAAQLQDPTFAAIAYDDIETLSKMEELTFGIRSFGGSLFAGVYSLSGGLYEAIGMPFTAVDIFADYIDTSLGIHDQLEESTKIPFTDYSLRNLPQDIGELFHGAAETQYAGADKVRGDLSRYNSTIQSAFQGFESVGMMAPGLAMTMFTGNPAFMFGSAGATVYGESYSTALDEGVDPSISIVKGLTDASIEIGTEMLPITHLIKDIKVGSSLFKMLMRQLMFEVPQEQLATVLQEYTDFLILPSQADLTFGDYLAQRPESAYHTLIATLTAVTTQTSAAHYTNRLMNKYTSGGIEIDPELKRYIEDNVRSSEAQTAHSKIEGLADLIKNSKMMENAPEQLKGFINELFQSQVEGQENPQVVIYAQDLIQYAQEQGIDVRDISPLIAEQLDETIANAGFFSFSIEDYLMEIATGEHAEGVNLLLRINENAMSVNEANSWSEEANQKLVEQAEALYASMGNKDVESADAVFEEVVNQLVGIGVPRDEANQSATLYKAFFTVMADRAGMDAKELFDKYGLNVQRNLPETAALAYAAQTQSLGELINEVLKPTVKAEVVKPEVIEPEEVVEAVEAEEITHEDITAMSLAELNAVTDAQLKAMDLGTFNTWLKAKSEKLDPETKEEVLARVESRLGSILSGTGQTVIMKDSQIEAVKEEFGQEYI